MISLGLSIALYHQVRGTAPLHPHNQATFQGLVGLRPAQDAVLIKAWAPRILSIRLANLLVQVTRQSNGFRSRHIVPADPVAVGISLWVAGWFAAVCSVWILAFRGRSLLYLFGTYACVSFAYMPGLDCRIYPWDMPPVFFFSVFVALIELRPQARWLPWVLTALIWFAIPFKETSVVLCVSPLFLAGNLSLPRRFLWAFAIGAGAIALKYAIGWIATGSIGSVTTASFDHDGSLLEWNLLNLGRNYVLWANAGTLFALFVLPRWQGHVLLLKLVALLFAGSNFIFGVASEYRIWLEMAPIAIYGLDVCLLRPPDSSGEMSA